MNSQEDDLDDREQKGAKGVSFIKGAKGKGKSGILKGKGKPGMLKGKGDIEESESATPPKKISRKRKSVAVDSDEEKASKASMKKAMKKR